MKSSPIIPLLFVVLFVFAFPGPTHALSIPTPTWSSSIYYFNPNDVATEASIIYYTNTGKTLVHNLGGSGFLSHQSGGILVGEYSATNMKGSAVLSSNKVLLAVYKQEATGQSQASPLLYSSFDVDQAGFGKFYIPTVQFRDAFNTQVGVQNVSSYPIEISLDFYDDEGNKTTVAEDDLSANPIPSLNSAIFYLSDLPGIEAGNIYSLVIHAHREGTADLAEIVAVAQEVVSGYSQAYTYEGALSGSQTVYMPTARCQFEDQKETTTFYVQNVGGSSTTVSVNYYLDGEASSYASSVDFATLAVGTWASISACQPGSTVTGKNLSAEFTSAASDIAVVAKTSTSNGLLSAYTGQPAPGISYQSGDGKWRVVLPLVEFSTKGGYRTYLSVQNVGTDPASSIKALYYLRNTTLVTEYELANATFPLASKTMRSTDPSAARAIPEGSRGFYGAVVIESDQPVVVTVRYQVRPRSGSAVLLGEDYSGIFYKKP